MNGDELLAQAARTLREHTDSGWVALRDDVVAAAVRAFRPSAPIRGRLRDGELWVASTALVSRVRDALAKIGRVHPELADHLRSSLRMGTLCSYSPAEPVTWTLS